MLELALDVGGGEGDGALAQADGVQVGVGEGEAEFFAGFAGAVGDGFAGVVVAADGDVGVVGSVERIAAWGFLLQDDAQVFLGGLDGQAIVAQDDEVGRDDEVTGPGGHDDGARSGGGALADHVLDGWRVPDGQHLLGDDGAERRELPVGGRVDQPAARERPPAAGRPAVPDWSPR